MDLLARREHGARELEQKLSGKGCPAAVASAAVEQLRRDGLVSDDRYVESLVMARREHGHGPLRIERELKEKGVDPSVVNHWLDARDPQWLEVLRDVYRKKYGDSPPGNFQERARRARFLQSRGFSAEQVMKVLKTDDYE
jgi:regulatory protein